MALALVPFDQNEIDGARFLQERFKGGLGLAAQLVHDRPPAARSDDHLGGAGHAVRMRILAGLVQVEIMMRVLDRRYSQSATDQARDEFREQRRLSRAAPAGKANDAHAPM